MRRWLQGLRPPRREEWAPLVLLVLPLRQLWLGWGHGRVTGIAGEPLYTHLYAGGQLRRWLSDGSWGTADLALGAGAWWPEHALVALWQSVLGLVMDEGLAYGGLLFIGVFLAGYGPWRWLQGRLDDPRPLGPALLAALLIQLSPPVLRAGLVGDLGILGLGPLALAACGSGVWALLAGLCSPAVALSTAALGLWQRRPRLAVALLPLLGALFSSGGVPGAVWPAEAAGSAAAMALEVPAYVGEGGAVLPLPPSEQASRAASDVELTLRGPESGSVPTAGPEVALDPLAAAAAGARGQAAPEDLPARWPGGLTLTIAVGLGLAVGARGPAVLALGALALGAAIVGWTPPAGSSLAPLGPLGEALRGWVPGLGGSGGQGAWLALPLLLVGLAASRLRWSSLLAGLVAFQALSEAPLHSPQLTSLSPSEATRALLGIPAGGVVIVPSPVAPWKQGSRGPAELLYAATVHAHPLELGLRPPEDAALVLALSRTLDLPVDISVAERAWALRDTDPWQAARDAGFTALLLDRSAGNAERHDLVDGLVAGRVGTAMAVGGDWVLHGLEPLGGGARTSPGAP